MRLVKTHTMGPHTAKVYKNPEWQENVVKTFRDGVYQPRNDYHTDDMSDAHGTAKAQLASWASQDAQNGHSDGIKAAVPTSNTSASSGLTGALMKTMSNGGGGDPARVAALRNRLANPKPGLF